ncbi:type 2 phosphatidylinositol 4,5-bisphosphate 4-phosphatase-like [Diaphorina citri]|uniref:Phosphatidylinositol-4,5-bisphosphate 4-phosphatase n=1 Tax=Diaphorina citri TaxID=121845 RepID=A0A1S4EMP0_DIACI|nr:type 2 phosphatidylinositol 4,5-bisphosphate 4-phosphatase-like [Diaphorina citri]
MEVNDYSECVKELNEVDNEIKQIQALNKEYMIKLEQVGELQEKCVQQISHQRYRLAVLSKSLKKELNMPVKNAPAGKKYVRCPCNCLLICKSSSIRIACPRVNCKRIINLAPSPITPPTNLSPGMSRVICVHCSDAFMFNTLNNALARCPHCRKV